MNNEDNKNTSLKIFFIKLISITLAVVIIINIIYNLLFAEKLEKAFFLLSLNEKSNIEMVKNKIRDELQRGLEKEKILNQKDKELIINIYLKIKNELNSKE